MTSLATPQRAGQRSRAVGQGNAHGVLRAAVTSGTNWRLPEEQVSGRGVRVAGRRAKVPEVYVRGRLSGGVLLVVVVDGGPGWARPDQGGQQDGGRDTPRPGASWCGSHTPARKYDSPACPTEVEQVIGEDTLRRRTGGGPSRGGVGGRWARAYPGHEATPGTYPAGGRFGGGAGSGSGDEPEDQHGVQVAVVAVDDGDPASAGLLGEQVDGVRLRAGVGVRQPRAWSGVGSSSREARTDMTAVRSLTVRSPRRIFSAASL